MEQSPSCYGWRFSANEVIPLLLRKNKVHYRVHNSPQPVPIPRHINPIHTIPTDLTNMHYKIILPPTPRFSKCSLFPTFSHQNPVCTSAYPHTCYMTRPSHMSRCDHSNNIWWGVQIMKPLLCIILQSPVTSFVLIPDYLRHHPILDKIPLMWETKFNTHTKQQAKV